jgi:uncharacterized SAM-binding protein YcdF (DUF218 family)
LLFLPWQKRGLRLASRVLRWLYLLAAIAALISFTLVQSAIWRTVAKARADEPNAPCLLVLGAGLFNGEYPSYVLQNRLLVARDYLRAHPNSVAVLAGGQGPNENVTEAFAMRRWLIGNDIAEERLYMEERSTSTYENIAFSLPIIRGLGHDTAVIVTNDFHLLRASMLARHYQLKTQLLGAPTPKIFLVPATYYTREYFALVRAWLLLNFYPQSLPQGG